MSGRHGMEIGIIHGMADGSVWIVGPDEASLLFQYENGEWREITGNWEGKSSPADGWFLVSGEIMGEGPE
jgi:hypothetical protein